MNKVHLIGRLTKDPDVRYSQGDNSTAIARYTLAVDRRFKREGESDADFISCIAFGKTGEHVEKYYKKGMKMVLSGRIQTGNYTNKDGQKVYTTDIIAEEVEFAESKTNGGGTENNSKTSSKQQLSKKQDEGFVNLDDIDQDELPFN